MNSKSARKRIPCSIILIIGAAIVISLIAIRYYLDKTEYSRGFQAYQQGDCLVAIGNFDHIINASRVFNFDGYVTLAAQRKLECMPLFTATLQEQNGDRKGAIVAYTRFVMSNSISVLTDAARKRIASIFEKNQPSTFVSQGLCVLMDALIQNNLVPLPDTNLPPLYFACGQDYDNANLQTNSYELYLAILTKYSSHQIATDALKALLSNESACNNIDSFRDKNEIINRPNLMPSLYRSCWQMYEKKSDFSQAFYMYRDLLSDYPTHPFAVEAEKALLSNQSSCENIEEFGGNSKIANITDFMPELYYHCGQMYEKNREYQKAVHMYEDFQKYFPSHPLNSNVNTELARSMVLAAKLSGSGEISAPELTGSTTEGSTVVIIRNDSPERLRIVFSGPEAHIEEMEACRTCTTYTGNGPLFCPNEGPVGQYTLAPGTFDVLVEAIDNKTIHPFTGTWTLSSGSEYSHCFFIVTTHFP